MEPFVMRVIIGVGVYLILNALIGVAVKKPQVAEIFHIILLIGVILYVFFGYLFPTLTLR